jgi:hypothetical protein
MINVHLHPGDDEHDINRRRKEVELLLEALKKKVVESRLWNQNIILVGDFNLYDKLDEDKETVQLIYDAGYFENKSLKDVPTNVAVLEKNVYDRLFMTDNEYFTFGLDEEGNPRAGVFNFFAYVFSVGEEQVYEQDMKAVYTGSSDLDDSEELKSYFNNYWRKNQMSDHLPIWFELGIDSSETFLKKLAAFQ